jgi:hypothetical protein
MTVAAKPSDAHKTAATKAPSSPRAGRPGSTVPRVLRLDVATSLDAVVGRTLGLSIARGLARAMGGDVSVAHAPTGDLLRVRGAGGGYPAAVSASPARPEHYAKAEGRRHTQSRPHAR